MFLVFLLPGMIFRRFYFLSEFSKQISTSEPILTTVAYALIPGSFIQLLGLLCYTAMWSPISEDSAHAMYSFFLGNDRIENFAEVLLAGDIYLYLLIVYAFSAFLGLAAYFVIRVFKLDRRIKILRFKNQWAYIFSGEILEFPKLRKLHPEAIRVRQTGLYLFPAIDVLIRRGSDTVLYSGILKDYDVDRHDINKLSRIYLFEAFRYKRRIVDSNVSGIEGNSNDGSQGEDMSSVSNEIERKQIPGDYLILMGEDIININVRYVYNESATKAGRLYDRRNLKGFFWSIYHTLSVLLFAFGGLLIVFNPESLLGIIGLSNSDISWYWRIPLLMATLQSYGILFPFALDDEELRLYGFIGWKFFLGSLIGIVTVVVSSCLFILSSHGKI